MLRLALDSLYTILQHRPYRLDNNTICRHQKHKFTYFVCSYYWSTSQHQHFLHLLHISLCCSFDLFLQAPLIIWIKHSTTLIPSPMYIKQFIYVLFIINTILYCYLRQPSVLTHHFFVPSTTQEAICLEWFPLFSTLFVHVPPSLTKLVWHYSTPANSINSNFYTNGRNLHIY